MRYLTLFLISNVLFLSCTQKNDIGKDKASNLKLEETKTEIKIPIDPKTSCESWCIQYFNDEGKDYLAILNTYENAIQIYDIQDTILKTKMKFEVEGGENATNKIKGFKIINKDTVFLTSFPYNIFFTNFDGVIYKKINYWKEATNGGYPFYNYGLTTVDNSLIYKAPHLLIAQQLIIGKDENIKYGADVNSKICLELDIHSETLRFLEMDHPLFGQKGADEVNPLYARIFNGSEFVYAPCSDHFIYITKDHKTVTPKKIKSHLLSENQFGIIGNYKPSQSIDEALVNSAKSGRYLNMLYDKYRKVYYRFVKLPSDVGNKYRPDIDYKNNKISVILIDDKFNILDELPLSENLYNWQMTFVNEKGLFISTNNVINPNFSPDYLSFNLISINTSTKK